MRSLLSSLATFLLVTVSVFAQESKKPFTLDECLAKGPALSPRGWPGLSWHPDGKHVTFLSRLREGGIGIVALPTSGEGQPVTVLSDQEVAEALAPLSKKSQGFTTLMSVTFVAAGHYRLDVDGDRYELSGTPLRARRLWSLPSDSSPIVASPDDSQVAYVHDYDVFVVGRDGVTHRVTTDGFEDRHYGVSVSREEFGIVDGLWWDPTGSRIAFYAEDLSVITPYPYIDHTTVPAKRRPGRYPMAGQRGSVVRVGVFDVGRDALVWLESPKDDLYLTNVTFSPDGTSIYVAEVARDQAHSELWRYDALTGKRQQRVLLEEDKEWVEPEHGPIFLPDGSGFLWFTYRTGFRHLDHHDLAGKRVAAVTSGKFDVLEFKGFTDAGRFLFEAATPDPRQRQLFEGSLAGAMRPITEERGYHETILSKDKQAVIDTWSALNTPLVIDILDVGSGKRIKRLYEAANPFAAYDVGSTEFFTTKNEAGDDLYGIVMFPHGIDDKKTYPVIQYVYGGPHSQLVQDRWMGMPGRWTPWLRALAEKGYIVFWLDGRGTANRGIEFSQAVHRKLGTCELEDQLAGLDYIAALPYADPTRVGVTGWSFGGFMTLTMMTRGGGRYAAGVAGGAVTDWSFYETGYGERYMDTPEENPEGYKSADPGSHVDGLKGRLLLVHGVDDATVMLQSAMDFLSDCIEAGKLVDTMFYPGETHGLRGKAWDHFLRLTTRYFDEHLTAGR